jgi:hypothetical protein
MLGSGVVQHNVRFSETAEDRKSERQLRDANRLRAFPRVPLQPIVIDVSGDVATALKSNNVEQIRLLLGITSVRRSKPITSKNGVVFTRQPYERRIAAPVDRRGVERQLTTRADKLRGTMPRPANGKPEEPA